MAGMLQAAVPHSKKNTRVTHNNFFWPKYLDSSGALSFLNILPRAYLAYSTVDKIRIRLVSALAGRLRGRSGSPGMHAARITSV